VVQDANDASDFADVLHFVGEIRGVSDDEFAFGDFVSGFDTGDAPVLVNESVDGLVEHICSSVDGGETSKGLGKLSETVSGIDVRRLSCVLGQRVAVEFDFLDGFESGSAEVLIVLMEGDGVAEEGLSVLVESEFLVQVGHGRLLEVETLVGLGFFLFVLLEIVREIATAPLLEHSHQAAAHDFHGSRRNSMNLLVFVDVAVLDGLELEISGNTCLQEEFHHQTRSHEEFGNEIDVVVSTLSERSWWFLAGNEFLVELVQVERSTFSTIIIISIDVEYFLPFNTENAADDAFFQSRAQHDTIVFLIHDFLKKM